MQCRQTNEDVEEDSINRSHRINHCMYQTIRVTLYLLQIISAKGISE